MSQGSQVPIPEESNALQSFMQNNVPRSKKTPQTLPSGYVKIAIENGHRNSGFSHEKW
jgi:hypothetical protein